jgi:sec-independent protein translocase protein TatA
MFEIVRSAIQFASLGGMEWVILIAIIIALFVGVKKIPELARSFGRASGEFEKAKIEMRKEIQRVKTGSNEEREKLESVATKLGIDYVDKNDEQLRKAIEEDLSKNKSSST